MKYVTIKNNCTGCTACESVCRKNAITIEKSLTCYNAIINEDLCVNCQMCYKKCPQNNELLKVKPMRWFQGWTTDEKIRLLSTSGGIATSLINAFILNGGWVCSCLYKNGDFLFELTNRIDVAKKFSGSKYVKSNPSKIFEKILIKLKEGNDVLFVGLPCQAAGLKMYVPEQLHNNLYLVDLICHGTPSKIMFDKFLSENDVDCKNLIDISFRNKIKKNNHIYISNPAIQDDYTSLFLKGLIFTENCYNCRYAGIERISDLTIGDSWGTELNFSEKEKGISLILCMTKKGLKLLSNKKLHLESVDIQKSIASNKQLQRPLINNFQKEFSKKIKKGTSFGYILFKYYPKIWIKKRLKSFLFKFKIIKNDKISKYGVSLINKSSK